MNGPPPVGSRGVMWLGALIVSVAAAAAVAAVLGSPADVVPTAPAEHVRPAALDDGRPILVSRDADGDPVVLAARRRVGGGWVGVVGWCDSADVLVDRLSARQWTADGRPRLPAGPGRAVETAGKVAPALARYDVEVADGRMRVGRRRSPDPETAVHEERRFRLCPAREVAAPPLPGDPIELDELDDVADGWHRVAATVDVASGPPRLCRVDADPPCEGVTLPALPDSARPLVASGLRGTVGVRVRDGVVDGVAVPADVREVR